MCQVYVLSDSGDACSTSLCHHTLCPVAQGLCNSYVKCRLWKYPMSCNVSEAPRDNHSTKIDLSALYLQLSLCVWKSSPLPCCNWWAFQDQLRVTFLLKPSLTSLSLFCQLCTSNHELLQFPNCFLPISKAPLSLSSLNIDPCWGYHLHTAEGPVGWTSCPITCWSLLSRA